MRSDDGDRAMNITDHNLASVLESLTPVERAAIEDCAKAARFATPEAVEHLRSAVLRKIRMRLKVMARSKRRSRFKWLM